MWNSFFSVLIIPQDKQQNVHKLKVRWAFFAIFAFLGFLLVGFVGYMYFQVFFTNKNWRNLNILETETAKNDAQIKKYKNELLRSLISIDELQTTQADLLSQSDLDLGGVSKQKTITNKDVAAKAAKDGILSVIKTNGTPKKPNFSPDNLIPYLAKVSDPNLTYPTKLPLDGITLSDFGTTENPYYPELIPVQGLLTSAKKGSRVVLPASGVVTDVGVAEQAVGYYVEIYHGYGVKTIYSCLKEVRWKVGDKLEAGTILGEAESNPVSDSALLYYQLLLYGIPQNPILNNQ